MGKQIPLANMSNNFRAVAECSPAFVELITPASVRVTEAQTKLTEIEVEGARAAQVGGFGWAQALDGSAVKRVGPTKAAKALDAVADFNAQNEVVRRARIDFATACSAAVSDAAVLNDLATELADQSRALTAASQVFEQARMVISGLESALVASKNADAELRAARTGSNRLTDGHKGGTVEPDVLASRAMALAQALVHTDDVLVGDGR